MHESLVEHLRCPRSGSPLRLHVDARDGAEVVTGRLEATAGGAVYAVRDGLPRFAGEMGQDQATTIDTFSAKWSKIPDYAENEAVRAHREAWYHERFGFTGGEPALREFLRGRARLLDAGVGVGVDVLRYRSACEATVFGIDLSAGVEVVARRHRGDPTVHLAQADLGACPFPPAYFDVISCDQVIHHTPDPPAYFQRLVRHLAPGGHMLFYAYRKKGPLREHADDVLRERAIGGTDAEAIDLSERLTRLGRALTRLQATVEVEDDLPELGIARGRHDLQRLIYDHVLKCFWNESYPYDVNVMVNYDWYRPTHAFRYSPEDLRGWCARAGLTIEREHVAPSGISIIARRP